ncbi:MAG: hypothetical protein CVU42_15015 [Chloroflexi bacterium HGW-Chloroflexi-4]|jgi:uncharacterized protein YbjT (DUF2867 family)|nr:MAG: hypothetical protein CVU45_06570 [Chloroflexi bacterium HGW-Chloroflexi-7]PKN97740.1 MAG: hypothetical protein CVU42_15015 [Chloroflexi bacterium HGW-Chloroflexi-4]
MILLTGAAGKTGTTILKHLANKGAEVRCLVRNPKQAEKVTSLGCTQAIIGDLTDHAALAKAIIGIDRIYFIAPNVSPDELSIGSKIIQLAQQNHVHHFVYHSVLHPQIEAMPHHWQKMHMEEVLFTSGLEFTILQPCAYMQNILGGWQKILAGEFSVPYQLDARISIVDLEDIAKVAAKVLTEPGYYKYAIYELAGPEALSQKEVANLLSRAINKPVRAIEQSRLEWEKSALAANMDETQVKVLIKMFEYYDKFGFVGNSSILEFLLGEKPTTFKQFLARISNSGDER